MNTDRMDAGLRSLERRLILPKPAFHTDPGDKADALRAAMFTFVVDRNLGGEAQDMANAVEEAAQELDRSVPHWWVYVVIAQSLALLAAAIAYSAPVCG